MVINVSIINNFIKNITTKENIKDQLMIKYQGFNFI